MSRNFNNYVKAFADMPSLVMTEKLDGQNNCFKESGVYAVMPLLGINLSSEVVPNEM